MVNYLLLFACLLTTGCVTAKFVPEGNETYPAKPKGYDVVVFVEGHQPKSEYQVIGTVFVERSSSQEFKGIKILNALKTQARLHGADAIVDFKIIRRKNIVRGEAEAIVFK